MDIYLSHSLLIRDTTVWLKTCPCLSINKDILKGTYCTYCYLLHYLDNLFPVLVYQESVLMLYVFIQLLKNKLSSSVWRLEFCVPKWQNYDFMECWFILKYYFLSNCFKCRIFMYCTMHNSRLCGLTQYDVKVSTI